MSDENYFIGIQALDYRHNVLSKCSYGKTNAIRIRPSMRREIQRYDFVRGRKMPNLLPPIGAVA